MKHYNFLSFPIVVLLLACNSNSNDLVQRINRGNAQGTTYNIQYQVKTGTDYQINIDSIFRFVDSEMSTYIPNSTISKLNKGENAPISEHFFKVLKKSEEVYELTGGFFDVTVFPLVNFWKIENKDENVILDSSKVDSVLHITGFKKVVFTENSVSLPKGMSLDLNAIAQGYTVDLIAEFLESKGVENYMVEVGGEVRAKGKTINENIWKIGIEKPTERTDQTAFQTVIVLKDKSLATSGSYRKYKTMPDGSRLSHVINPITGYPANHNLLSVSVVADDCMTADALATALLVMGLEGAKQFAKAHPEWDYYFIYFDKYKGYNTWSSDGFKEMMFK